MTSPRRFESDLPALLADLYLAGTPDYRDDVVQRIVRMPQRPAWTFPERWLPVELVSQRVPTTRMPWRQLAVLALIALLLAAMLAVYIGTHTPRLPPPFGVARNGTMVYESGGDIYELDPITGRSTAVVAGPQIDSFPMFSRDGTRLGFFRKTGTGRSSDLVVADSDGSDQRVVTKDPVTTDFSINWSADGRSILVDDTHGRLTRLDTIGNASPQQTTYPDMADIVAPRPPAETQLLYRTASAGGWSLRLVDADGTDERPVLPPDAVGHRQEDYSGYAWSPDGSRIAFRNHPDASDDVRIFIVNSDGTGLHRLTPEPGTWCECDMFWSPDGTKIAFNRWQLDPTSGEWHVRPVAIASVDDGTIRDIGPMPSDQGADFAFSPDGASLLWQPRAPEDSAAAPHRPILLDIASGAERSLDVSIDSGPDWQRLAP
jgi:Tol biopolymer transport system component